MPFWRLFYHVVWATKNRDPVIDGRMAEAVERMVRAVAIEQGVMIHAIGTMPDHVQVAASIPPAQPLPAVIGRWKGASSHLLNHAEKRGDYVFAWQSEYGILSFGAHALPKVVAYVRDQPTRHAREGALWPLLERDSEDAPDSSRLQPGSSS